MMSYNPLDWYWKADDGRVFSSSKQSVVASDDADFVAWSTQTGMGATPWPRDLQGNQTTASLQDVLTPYGLFADLASYAADRRWRKEVGGFTFNGVIYPTDRDTQSKMASAFLLASADSTSTFKWKLNDGTFTPTLDATTMQGVAKAIGEFVNGCFTTEETVVAGITGGTITTKAQIDAAFA